VDKTRDPYGDLKNKPEEVKNEVGETKKD